METWRSLSREGVKIGSDFRGYRLAFCDTLPAAFSPLHASRSVTGDTASSFLGSRRRCLVMQNVQGFHAVTQKSSMFWPLIIGGKDERRHSTSAQVRSISGDRRNATDEEGR